MVVNLVILLTALWPVLRAKSTLPPLLLVLMKVLASALRKGRREEACKTNVEHRRMHRSRVNWSKVQYLDSFGAVLYLEGP